MPYTTLIDCNSAYTQLNHPHWRFIDCRFDLLQPHSGRQLYLRDHLPGALYAHLDEALSAPMRPDSGRHPLPDIDALAATFGRWGIDATTQVVAYDDGIGMFASRLWWLLRWLGHEQVAVLDGGYQAWQAAGLPLSNELPTPLAATSFQPRVQADWVVETAAIEQRQAEGFVLLDARAPERFRGELEPIDPKAGHIPGARNYPLGENIHAGRFKDAATLASQLGAVLEETPPQRVIHYCGSGVSACHNILAMEHAGLHGSRLYAGSWSEWIRDPTHAIACA